MEINRIESLPKIVTCEEELYALDMHITAWNKICLCYAKVFPDRKAKDSFKNTIFSQVVEPEMVGNPEFSECIYDIVSVSNFEQAVNMIWQRIKDAISKKIVEEYNP